MRKTAEAHWKYVEELLNINGISDNIIAISKFHYISAFMHGWKHAEENMRSLGYKGMSDDDKGYLSDELNKERYYAEMDKRDMMDAKGVD